MEKVFLKVAAGEMEPAAWEQWWNSHQRELAKALNPYMRQRIMPPEWSADYYWMLKTQSGIAYYFYNQGRPVNCSDYYEQKTQEEKAENRRQAMQAFHSQTAPVRQQWEAYLALHPAKTVDFDWKSLQGTPPGQRPPRVFSYKKPRTPEEWKETGAEIKERLKENLQAKIAPLAKAYGMKKAGPQAFVRESNGLVFYLRFVGYFRGGGYEQLYHSFGPIYDIQAGPSRLPGFVTAGELFQKVQQDWGVLQYIPEGAVDAGRVERINRKFDDILAFLADGLFPEWQKIDSLETYFAKERMEYLKAAEVGPADLHTGRPMWNVRPGQNPDPWCADAYLFGVWNLLSGREEEGYRQLAECVKHGDGYMQQCLKVCPTAYNDKRDPMAILYYNAGLFLKTQQIVDATRRLQAIWDTYENIYHFMQYYHGLSKKVERDRNGKVV